MGVALPPTPTFTHRFRWSVEGRIFLCLLMPIQNGQMKWTTAEKIIKVMRTLFGSYRIPEQVMSDNDSQFYPFSWFSKFMRRNCIKHIRGTPYHPSTNGLGNDSFKVLNELYKPVNRVKDHSIRGWSIFYLVIKPHRTPQLIGPLAVYFWSELHCFYLSPPISIVENPEATIHYIRILCNINKLMSYCIGDPLLLSNNCS